MQTDGERPDPRCLFSGLPKCGKEILTDSGDLTDVGYSITKRGTANFWHESCKGDVWNSRIK